MSIEFENPLTAGTVLVREQIQSQNYTEGVSGWVIKANGDAEFNSVTIRGSVTQGGVALYYDGAPALGNLIMSIAASAGTDEFGNDYLAGTTVYDSSGSYIEMNSGSGSSSLRFRPSDVSGVVWQPGYVVASRGSRLGTNTPILAMQAPYNDDLASAASIQLFGNPEVSNGDVTNEIYMGTFRVTITGDLEVGQYARAQNMQSRQESISFAGLSSYTTRISYPAAFETGAVPRVITNIASAAGNTARWQSRAYAIDNTGFTLFLFKGDSADPVQTWTNIPVQWWAHHD